MGKRCVVASDCDSFICNAGECIADDPVAATDIIDDMEDGDNKIAPIGARSGVWYAFNDKSGGTQAPLGAVNGERIPDGGRGESRFAMHTSGGGFTQWGSGIGFDFNNPNGGEATKLPYDATGYSGIRLWARAAEEQPLRMTVPDVRTDPAGNLCSDTEKGCDDHFGVLLQVGTEWRRFDVPFATLRQQGFGNPEPDGLAIGDLLGVHFQVPANSDFDFWIDDVSLY
jgi:hypothetical protein